MSTKTTAADVDPLALERQVGFVLASTSRAVVEVYRPLLEPLGMTHPQYLVMLALWAHPRSSPEPLPAKQIAAALQLDSATLSPMRKRLEVLGLINRSRGTTDERTTPLELTPDGFAVRRQALKIPPAVKRLGVDLDRRERLPERPSRMNTAAPVAGAIANEPARGRRRLAQLSGEHRGVLRSSFYLGWTTTQIANDHQIADSTVKSRLHYALQPLRLKLQEKA